MLLYLPHHCSAVKPLKAAMDLPVLWGMFEPAKEDRPGEVHLSARDRSRVGIAPGSGSHHQLLTQL
jgi:hypothetical protein